MTETPSFRRYDDGSIVFSPCSKNDHKDCIGKTTKIYRDGRLVVCDCHCHKSEEHQQ